MSIGKVFPRPSEVPSRKMAEAGKGEGDWYAPVPSSAFRAWNAIVYRSSVRGAKYARHDTSSELVS